MMVLIGRTGGLPEPLGMSLHLRRGAVEERGAAPSPESFGSLGEHGQNSRSERGTIGGWCGSG